MTIKKDKSRKIYEEEDMLNRKKRKQYKKIKKRDSWEDRDDSYDDNYYEDNIYDDSYLDYLYDDEDDDIRQIVNIHNWVKNN